ncbi:hypothetical protein NA57DRAFT_78478 [Rhizodiscina lignyota]|uniref:Uncharacterized protein n=1 Tax=Rhizodiscina lignyota TaxID=1504668 RepID=A0A9P4IBA6_9PEZI|nr:hypothetical protein NA57DRAFT_78478 [Rhizodiscina lignyota]
MYTTGNEMDSPSSTRKILTPVSRREKSASPYSDSGIENTTGVQSQYVWMTPSSTMSPFTHTPSTLPAGTRDQDADDKMDGDSDGRPGLPAIPATLQQETEFHARYLEAESMTIPAPTKRSTHGKGFACKIPHHQCSICLTDLLENSIYLVQEMRDDLCERRGEAPIHSTIAFIDSTSLGADGRAREIVVTVREVDCGCEECVARPKERPGRKKLGMVYTTDDQGRDIIPERRFMLKKEKGGLVAETEMRQWTAEAIANFQTGSGTESSDDDEEHHQHDPYAKQDLDEDSEASAESTKSSSDNGVPRNMGKRAAGQRKANGGNSQTKKSPGTMPKKQTAVTAQSSPNAQSTPLRRSTRQTKRKATEEAETVNTKRVKVDSPVQVSIALAGATTERDRKRKREQVEVQIAPKPTRVVRLKINWQRKDAQGTNTASNTVSDLTQGVQTSNTTAGSKHKVEEVEEAEQSASKKVKSKGRSEEEAPKEKPTVGRKLAVPRAKKVPTPKKSKTSSKGVAAEEAPAIKLTAAPTQKAADVQKGAATQNGNKGNKDKTPEKRVGDMDAGLKSEAGKGSNTPRRKPMLKITYKAYEAAKAARAEDGV